MAQRLSSRAFAYAAALVAAPAGWAQGALPDPTRPPSAPAVTNVQASPGNDASPAAPMQPRLQSVLLAGARKLAVIDGVTVSLGEKLDDATVVEISETQVKLRRGGEVETLELYPGIERRPIGPAGESKK